MGVEVMVTVGGGTKGRMMISLVRVNTLHVHTLNNNIHYCSDC